MKYKYLVTAGCSMTFGQECSIEKTYANRLADRLGLKLINLASCGSGWYSLQTVITSFINNNKDILNECFFILQSSTLERRVNYTEIALIESDAFEKYNIKYLSSIQAASLGFNDWKKYYDVHRKPDWFTYGSRNGALFCSEHDVNKKLLYFPEHKLYPHSRNQWKWPEGNKEIIPVNIHEQFESLIEHWAQQISSFHFFLKNLNIDHLVVDGYVPFVSYKQNFKNYFDTEAELKYTKMFWSTNTSDLNDKEEGIDDYMVYDFKNIKAGWIFDSIDSKYKIDDMIMWNLFSWKQHNTEWNVDGGHAGPAGMELISNAIYKNLIEKNWFNE